MFKYRRDGPINAISAIIPTLVERRSPRIRISIGIIRIVRIGPPYEKESDVSTAVGDRAPLLARGSSLQVSSATKYYGGNELTNSAQLVIVRKGGSIASFDRRPITTSDCVRGRRGSV